MGAVMLRNLMAGDASNTATPAEDTVVISTRKQPLATGEVPDSPALETVGSNPSGMRLVWLGVRRTWTWILLSLPLC